MKQKHLVLLAFALLAAGLTVWFTWPGKNKSPGDPSKSRYLHCPECKRESRYTPAEAEKLCLYCEKNRVATEDSIKVSGKSAGSPYNRMGTLLIVEAILFLGLAWFISKPGAADEHENFLYINCDRCGQKIRYHVNQVGSAAMCRRCKHTFTYPEAEE